MITVDGFTIDAALTEEHQRSSELTKFPIENGSPISDHVITNPDVLSIEGVVSDTPLGRAAVVRGATQAFLGPSVSAGLLEATVPSADAFAKLEQVHNDRLPVTVTSSLKIYENMVMTSLSIPRDKGGGASLRFSATFEKANIVENRRTRVRSQHPPKSSAGNRSARKLDGKHNVFCLAKQKVYVKAADLSRARRSELTDEIFTDYLTLPFSEYTTPITLCTKKESLQFDPDANGGKGEYLHADGRPMTPDERIDHAMQISDNSDIVGATGKVPVDKRSGLPITQSAQPPGKLPWRDANGKPWWDQPEERQLQGYEPKTLQGYKTGFPSF